MNKRMHNTLKKNYDVVIIGGGLAGFTLARQLLLQLPQLTILIAERRAHPVPEAAYKVGESTVEIGSHYLAEKLQLKDYLEKNHLPKAGLRFFFTHGNNENIETRLEFGATTLPPTPSYQLDRGRLENDLRDMVVSAGATFIDKTRVSNVELGKQHHTLQLQSGSKKQTVTTHWIVDASGRMGILKKQLELSKEVHHDVNASWFRLDAEIDLQQWSNQPTWQQQVPDGIRHLSTNHFMGSGYWLWFIPLASKATSVGIVADNRLHPHNTISTFNAVCDWLEKYEPQAAEILAQYATQRRDFHTLKHFSYNITQVYSAKRWAITGEAGAFLDPFYSPGTDFISISNDFICDLILRDQKNEDIARHTFLHNQLYLEMVNSFFNVYSQQYPLMGNTSVMLTKIVWDYAAYWGITGLLYFSNKLCDLSFMTELLSKLHQFRKLNNKMQLFFREWQPTAAAEVNASFIDTLSLPLLQKLNNELQHTFNDKKLIEKLTENFSLLQRLANTIMLLAPTLTVKNKNSSTLSASSLDKFLRKICA